MKIARIVAEMTGTRSIRSFVFVILLLPALLAGQGVPPPDLEAYDRFLLPIAPGPARPGAYGTVWESHLTVRNAGDAPATVFHFAGAFFCLPDFPIACEPGDPLPPHSTMTTLLPETFGPPFSGFGTALVGPGALFYVERERADEVFLNILVRERNSQNLNQGTEIPVVREAEMFRRPLELLNVLIPASARGMLRLYAVSDDASTVPLLRVSAYPLASEDLLGETVLSLPRDGAPRFPHYTQVDLGSESFPLPSGEWVRLRIEPVNDGFSYWGFVSVTNNETQLISIVTPQ